MLCNGKRVLRGPGSREGSRSPLGDDECPPCHVEMRGALALAGVPYRRLIAISRASRATDAQAGTAPDSRRGIDAQMMAACWRAAGTAY